MIYFPLQTRFRSEKNIAVLSSLWVWPLIAASHSSLSADVFLRSASGNISINTAGFLLTLIIAILKHNLPVSLCLPEEDGTLRAYTFRLCNSLPSHNSPDEPATSGGVTTDAAGGGIVLVSDR